MKKILKFNFLSFLLLALSLVLFIGCDFSNNKYDNDLDIYDIIEESYIEYQEGDNKNSVTGDVTFCVTLDYRFKYKWESNHPEIIDNTGKVSRPQEDTLVTIRLTVSNEEISLYNEFYLNVLKAIEVSDEYSFDIEGTKSFLSINDLNNVAIDQEYSRHLDVIAYIHKYHKLPSNYLTKSQAKSLGWRGSGNVWANDSLYGKCIGGDTFNNREQILPITASNTYIEVDVNCTNGNRGACRIVYNRYTFDIYYTDNHYESFVYMIGEIK